MISSCPKKHQILLRQFENDSESVWCFHPLRYAEYVGNEEKEFIVNYPFPPSDESPCKIDFRSEIVERAKHPNWGPAASALCFRRSLLKQILPIPESIKIKSDNYIRYTSVYLGKGVFINESLSILRIHENNSYSLRSDKTHQKSQVLINTAYYLLANYSDLRRFSNKLVGIAFGVRWLVGADKVGYQKLFIITSQAPLYLSL